MRHFARHADRLAGAAEYFGFPYAEEELLAHVQAATASLPGAPHFVRLTLGAGGGLRCEAGPLATKEQEPLRLVLAGQRAQTADPFFQYKTTWRRVYERAYRTARQAGGDEALLLNERGEVTEGTRANLFLEEDGQIYTPPVRCGLLPGVGRAVWLEEEQVKERVLQVGDLQAAEALWLVSALRGRRRAVLVEGRERAGNQA